MSCWSLTARHPHQLGHWLPGRHPHRPPPAHPTPIHVQWAALLALISAPRDVFPTCPYPCAQTLRGEHLSRCIGRLAGKGGKTKYTIENTTRTRIVLADTKIWILGSFQNIRVARFLPSPPIPASGSSPRWLMRMSMN